MIVHSDITLTDTDFKNCRVIAMDGDVWMTFQHKLNIWLGGDKRKAVAQLRTIVRLLEDAVGRPEEVHP